MLPAGATFVPPPSSYAKGMIPVFDELTQSWNIREDNFWRPIVRERNYYTGRDAMGISQLPQLSSFVLCRFPGIPKLLNTGLFSMRFSERHRIINEKVREIYVKHSELFSVDGNTTYKLVSYKVNIETIVHLLKKSLDDYVTLVFVRDNLEEVKITHKVFFDDIGKFFSPTNDNNSKVIRLKAAIKFDKHKEFLKVIVDLHNAMKHDLLLSETDNIIGVDYPTVVAFDTDKGRLTNIDYHNHSLGQIVLGYTDFLVDNLGLEVPK